MKGEFSKLKARSIPTIVKQRLFTPDMLFVVQVQRLYSSGQ
jgi:hypothetical protein